MNSKEKIYTEGLVYLQEIDYPSLTLEDLIDIIENPQRTNNKPKRSRHEDIRRLFEQFIEDRLTDCYPEEEDDLVDFFTKYKERYI